MRRSTPSKHLDALPTIIASSLAAFRMRASKAEKPYTFVQETVCIRLRLDIPGTRTPDVHAQSRTAAAKYPPSLTNLGNDFVKSRPFEEGQKSTAAT